MNQLRYRRDQAIDDIDCRLCDPPFDPDCPLCAGTGIADAVETSKYLADNE